MKKLMIVAATLCVAMLAHAGTVNWTTVTMYGATGSKVKNAATVYVYMLADAAAYTGLTDIWAKYGDDVKAGGTTASNKAGSNSITSKASIPSPDGTAVANTTYYAAIIATYGTGDDMKYYVEKATVTTGDDGNGAYTTFGAGALDSATAAAGAWKSAGGSSPVPEPTSGLLMLLGVAGLALKRKRA